MKIRDDYEYHGWKRFLHWLDGDAKEDFIPEGAENFLRKKETVEKKESTFKKLSKQFYEHGTETFATFYNVMGIFVAAVIIGVLLITVMNLPEFGNAANPTNNEVVTRYVESGLQETGAVNIVAGIILDYRAFDTLGESHVLFIAVCSVLILLRMDYSKSGEVKSSSGTQDEGYDRQFEPRHDVILQAATKALFPLIVLFGIYVILNGHISAGGGFAGGAIIGAALILYNNAFGFKSARRFFTYNTFKWVSLTALLSYACLKTYSFYTGANHLHSGIPLGTPGAILSSGLILPLNICVGCVVACTMYTFFVMFRKGGM